MKTMRSVALTDGPGRALRKATRRFLGTQGWGGHGIWRGDTDRLERMLIYLIGGQAGFAFIIGPDDVISGAISISLGLWIGLSACGYKLERRLINVAKGLGKREPWGNS
jgi:hypothetical protein